MLRLFQKVVRNIMNDTLLFSSTVPKRDLSPSTEATPIFEIYLRKLEERLRTHSIPFVCLLGETEAYKHPDMLLLRAYRILSVC
jgi:hypothetical protein